MVTSGLANFKQAWHTQVELEISAIENELEEPIKKKKRLPSSSSDDSFIEGNYIEGIFLLFVSMD